MLFWHWQMASKYSAIELVAAKKNGNLNGFFSPSHIFNILAQICENTQALDGTQSGQRSIGHPLGKHSSFLRHVNPQTVNSLRLTFVHSRSIGQPDRKLQSAKKKIRNPPEGNRHGVAGDKMMSLPIKFLENELLPIRCLSFVN